MRIKKISFLLSIIFLLSFFTSCGKKIDTEGLRSYSDGALESILMAANKDDYEKYSKDFSDKMKELLTEKNFKQQNKVIKEKIGDYVSKEFVKATIKRDKGIDYIVAIYKAKYTDEPKEVMVSITFRENDENHKVEGLFMTSPKLVSK